MNNSHKINRRSHFTALQSVLFFIAFIVISFGLLFYFNNDSTYFIERVLGGISIFIIGPSLYLHFCYYLENKDLLITGLDESLAIEDTKSNKKWILSNETILSIDIYAAPEMINYGAAGGMLHLTYHYAIIKTKDQEFILTSLLYPYLMDIKFKFIEVKVNYHKTIFALI